MATTRSSDSSRSSRRHAASVERWQSETTPSLPPKRERARELGENDDPMAHNAWDDVGWDDGEREQTDAIIRDTPLAAASTAAACVEHAAERWDAHYHTNIRNYHDRRYLQNEFAPLAALLAADSKRAAVLLETGCGAGNAVLPLLAATRRLRVLACDISAAAVDLVRERCAREALGHRASSFVWDVGADPPLPSALPAGGVDVVLSVFTLSALPPDRLATAFANLYACLAPGGALLLRDYGRRDLKQLKFARASGAGGRLPCDGADEWYVRGDGTTVVFFSEARLRELATAAGFEVESLAEDHRLVVNRATQTKMRRVWVAGVFRKPGAPPTEAARRNWALPLALAACAAAAILAVRARRR